jgi:hypothetical protein
MHKHFHISKHSNTISSHEFFRYILSVRPFFTTLATRGCCRPFGSSTMVDPFILQTGWGALCNLLLLILAVSYTLVSARLFPLQLTTKWSIYFLVCRCCTPCTTGRGDSTLIHRPQFHRILPTLLLFGWHDFRAFMGNFKRELRVPYSSQPKATQSCHSSLLIHLMMRRLNIWSQCHWPPAQQLFH